MVTRRNGILPDQIKIKAQLMCILDVCFLPDAQQGLKKSLSAVDVRSDLDPSTGRCIWAACSRRKDLRNQGA